MVENNQEIIAKLAEIFRLYAERESEKAKNLEKELKLHIIALTQEEYKRIIAELGKIGLDLGKAKNFEWVIIFIELLIKLAEIRGQELGEKIEYVARSHNEYASRLKEQNLYKEAEAHYKRALELKEDIPECHNSYAVLLSEQKRYQEAEKHFYQAVRFSNSPEEVYKFTLRAIYIGFLRAEFEQRHSLKDEERKMNYKKDIHHLLSRLDDLRKDLENLIKAIKKEEGRWYQKVYLFFRNMRPFNLKRIFEQGLRDWFWYWRKQIYRYKNTIELQEFLSCVHHFQAVMFTKIEDYGMAYFHARHMIKTHPRLRYSFIRLYRCLTDEKKYNCYKHILYV